MARLHGTIVVPETDCRGFQQSPRDANKNFTITYRGIVAICAFVGLDDSGYHTYSACIMNTASGTPINMPGPRRTIETQHWCWDTLEEVYQEKQNLETIQEETCLISNTPNPNPLS